MSKKFGLLLRSYAKTKAEVSGVVERAIASIRRADEMRDEEGNAQFGQIVVIVPRDYDCSSTAELIRKHMDFIVPNSRVAVIEPKGHHSCGALNAGVDLLWDACYKRVVIISNKTIVALTAPAMTAISAAFQEGAKVVGVAVDELGDIVRQGRVQNTFAAWDIKALVGVGVFDSDGGVEEIAPSIRLVRKYGQCIAVLIPSEIPVLDIRQSQDGVARHREVMVTKIARQGHEMFRLDADHDFLEKGIMPGYPKTF